MYRLTIKAVKIYYDDSHEYIEHNFDYSTLEELNQDKPRVLSIYKTASCINHGCEYKDRKYCITLI